MHAKVHIDMVEKLIINTPLVSRLLASQFPEWKTLPIRPVLFNGWDNKTFRLGDGMLVRLPSAKRYENQVEKEQHWLPKLIPLLPLQIPTPLAQGKPGEGYPWKWSIYRWIEADHTASGYIPDLCIFADELASFLIAFEQIDITEGPLPGVHNFYRGGALSMYDTEVRQALAVLKGKMEIKIASNLWEAALKTSYRKRLVWVHGDISPGNLLMRNGQLCAVIDFGQLAIGDPACDLSIAWTLLREKSREIFRKKLCLDKDTWTCGRGWTLWKALIHAAKLTHSNSFEAKRCWEILAEVIGDYKKQEGGL